MVSLTIQSLLARALDGNMFTCLSSLDLSAAYDDVNVGLMCKCLTMVGLLPNVERLIRRWLS